MAINAVSLTVMVCSGIAVATVVDLVRIAVSALKSPLIRKLAGVLEVLVWAFLGCATFYLLLIVKHGDWRAVDALAQILGIYVYNLYLRGIIHFIASLLYKLFVVPFLWMGHVFVAFVRKSLKFFIKIIKVPRMFLNLFSKNGKKHISK